MLGMYLLVGLGNLLKQIPGGQPHGSFSQDDDLLQTVRSGHCHLITAANLLGDFLNVLVGGFRLLGKDNVNVVILKDLAGIPLDFVAVEYQDDLTFFIPLVVAENILELGSGAVQIDIRQLL